MLMVFVGPLLKLLGQKEVTRMVADFLMGLGIMFVGMYFMNNIFETSFLLRDFFTGLFENVHYPFFLLLLGVLLTCIIQSSMAALALLVGMMASDIITLDKAIFIMMGANVGMCLAVYLTSLNKNINARRAAIIYFLFNAIGAIFFTIVFWSFSNILLSPIQRLGPVWQLSIFNIAFNLATALLLIGFIHPLIRLSEWMID